MPNNRQIIAHFEAGISARSAALCLLIGATRVGFPFLHSCDCKKGSTFSGLISAIMTENRIYCAASYEESR